MILRKENEIELFCSSNINDKENKKMHSKTSMDEKLSDL